MEIFFIILWVIYSYALSRELANRNKEKLSTRKIFLTTLIITPVISWSIYFSFLFFDALKIICIPEWSVVIIGFVCFILIPTISPYISTKVIYMIFRSSNKLPSLQ